MIRYANDDIYIDGKLTVGSFVLPNGAVTDSKVDSGAAIQATKLEHEHVQITETNGYNTNAATGQWLVHIARGPAVIQDFSVFDRVAATVDATVTIDILKNGVSILSATYSLTASVTAYSVHSIMSSIASPNLVAGDVIEMKISAVSAGAGALPKGVAGVLTVYEDPIN